MVLSVLPVFWSSICSLFFIIKTLTHGVKWRKFLLHHHLASNSPLPLKGRIHSSEFTAEENVSVPVDTCTSVWSFSNFVFLHEVLKYSESQCHHYAN
jgi:hypothetical protein